MRNFWACAAFLTLAGCASERTPVLYCPRPAVLAQAQNEAVFLPGRSDVAAEVTAARVTGVAGSCTLRHKTVLVVSLQAGFSASNGPANHGADVTLPYFVAIAQGDTVVSKNLYAVTLHFDGNAQTATAVSAPVKIDLPNVTDSAGLDVLVGFQLDQAQLAAGDEQ